MCTERAVPSPVLSKDGVDMAQRLELADAPQLKHSYILPHSNPRVTLFCCRTFPIGGNRKAGIYKIAQPISINNIICKHKWTSPNTSLSRSIQSFRNLAYDRQNVSTEWLGSLFFHFENLILFK
jgi:hypothetical protein